MIRFQDWPNRLAEFTEQARTKTFIWGTWDCALAAAAEIEALTGVDTAAEYRGYSDEAGAKEALLRVCGGGLAEAATMALGPPLKTHKLAQRGDICLMTTALGPTLGWCLGSAVACVGLTGLAFLPLRDAKMAWRV